MAKEGFFIFGIFVLITFLFFLLFGYSGSFIYFVLILIFSFLSIFSVYFFRDPKRNIPNDPNILVSPADGKIVDISPIDDDFVGKEAIKISIFLSVFDVHINRSPEECSVYFVKYFPGTFNLAWKEKASLENEQTHIGLKCNNYNLLVKQIAGTVARRIVCKIKEGDSLTRGQKIGMIKFGSRTDLIMPNNFKPLVKQGDMVYGGKSKIASY